MTNEKYITALRALLDHCEFVWGHGLTSGFWAESAEALRYAIEMLEKGDEK